MKKYNHCNHCFFKYFCTAPLLSPPPPPLSNSDFGQKNKKICRAWQMWGKNKLLGRTTKSGLYFAISLPHSLGRVAPRGCWLWCLRLERSPSCRQEVEMIVCPNEFSRGKRRSDAVSICQVPLPIKIANIYLVTLLNTICGKISEMEIAFVFVP